MNTKICTKCQLEKPIQEFITKSKSKDKHRAICKECHREVCRKYYYQNKDKYRSRSKINREELRQYVNRLKVECCICGESDVACLDFHHIDDKIMNVSQLINSESIELIKREIEKCIVICSNCHRKLHYYNLSIDQLKNNSYQKIFNK